MSDRRLLLFHAHPDDESIGTGITMARYVAEGAQVTLVTSTLGEEGEVLEPQYALLAADQADQLGGLRVWELAEAMRHLGVTDHRFLGGAGRYRDSGMMGTPANDKPRAFWQLSKDAARFDEAVLAAVEVIREVRPQVVITYDPDGEYGHPDHIMTHRVATAAVERAADPSYGHGEAWDVAKVYWPAYPRSEAVKGIEAAKAAGTDFFGVTDVADVQWATDDALVTSVVRGEAFVEAKMAAMAAHPTQIALDGPFFALSNNLGLAVWADEYFQLAKGEAGPDRDGDGREVDLFSGLAG